MHDSIRRRKNVLKVPSFVADLETSTSQRRRTSLRRFQVDAICRRRLPVAASRRSVDAKSNRLQQKLVAFYLPI